jgi:hypothetical protein
MPADADRFPPRDAPAGSTPWGGSPPHTTTTAKLEPPGSRRPSAPPADFLHEDRRRISDTEWGRPRTDSGPLGPVRNGLGGAGLSRRGRCAALVLLHDPPSEATGAHTGLGPPVTRLTRGLSVLA